MTEAAWFVTVRLARRKNFKKHTCRIDADRHDWTDISPFFSRPREGKVWPLQFGTMRGKRPKPEEKRRGTYQTREVSDLLGAICQLAHDFPHENISRTQKIHARVPRRTLSDYWASIRPLVFERMKAGLRIDQDFFFSLLHKKIMGRPTDFSPKEESFIVAEAVRAFSRAIPLTTRLLRRIYARRRASCQCRQRDGHCRLCRGTQSCYPSGKPRC